MRTHIRPTSILQRHKPPSKTEVRNHPALLSAPLLLRALLPPHHLEAPRSPRRWCARHPSGLAGPASLKLHILTWVVHRASKCKAKLGWFTKSVFYEASVNFEWISCKLFQKSSPLRPFNEFSKNLQSRRHQVMPSYELM